MRRAPLVPIAIALITLTACGGTDADTGADTDAGGSDTTAVTTAQETVTVPTTPASAAPATPPATPPATAPAPTTAASGGDADCLNGSWRADAAEFQRRFDELDFPLPFIIADGSHSDLTIDDGTFAASSETTVSAEIPGTGVLLTASGSSTAEGTFTVDGNTILADVTSDTTSIGEWSASLNGEEIALPDVGFDNPPDTSFDFNGSTFTCEGDSLTFDVIESQYGTITYTRVG